MLVKLVPSVIRTVISRFLKKVSKSAVSLSLYLETLNLLTPEENRIIARNAIFRDKHKGRRAFVIVNGPSLKKQDMRLLKGEITFVVSGFWKHPIVELWQPTYYTFLDKNFFVHNESIAKFYNELNSKIKKSIFFLPLLRGYEFNEKYNYLNRGRTFYIASNGDPFPSVDLTSLIQGFAGVSAFALAQAIYMGCSPIYLLGFDHDYLANRGTDHHFYEGGTLQGLKGTSVPRIPYDVEMEANYRLWQSYRSLKTAAESKNIKIFNATSGGYLDVFDRIDYENIFHRIKNGDVI